MAGTNFKVEFNVSEFEQYVNSLAKFNLAEILDDIGGLVETQTQDRFEEKKAPDGTAWADWSTKYEKSKKGIDLLRNTQHLFGSISYQIKGDNVEVGSNVEYSATHQYGDNTREITRKTKNGRSEAFKRNIPARPFLGLSEDNKLAINDLVLEYIRGLSE